MSDLSFHCVGLGGGGGFLVCVFFFLFPQCNGRWAVFSLHEKISSWPGQTVYFVWLKMKKVSSTLFIVSVCVGHGFSLSMQVFERDVSQIDIMRLKKDVCVT